jgi:hypothetical protein
MQTKVFELVPRTTFTKFAETHGLVMEIRERPVTDGGDPMRYYASFEGVEVMDNGCLVGEYGNGASHEDAIDAYARKLRGRRIAVHAMYDDRRDIQCPNEWIDE